MKRSLTAIPQNTVDFSSRYGMIAAQMKQDISTTNFYNGVSGGKILFVKNIARSTYK
jgi:hypothetical protein